MISRVQYETLVRLNAAFEAWRAGRSSWKTEDVPAEVNITNEQRSQIELYEFVHTPPKRYFLYCKFAQDETGREFTHYGASGEATTWMGDSLGKVQCGSQWRSNMGDIRVPITVYATNGYVYHGTYYKSSGNYARVKMSAKSLKKLASCS